MKNILKNNLNIPKTLFSMRGNLLNKELEILKKWKKIDIYSKISINYKKKNYFFLHDGPPYANGCLHIGHAVNKILKDIIIKYKRLLGFFSPFLPGWDCHGLPIELNIKKEYNDDKNFFKICRKYVSNQIENQKNSFIRLGILADWNNSYLTMNYKMESYTIDVLRKLLKLNFLERKNKPVYWCIKCKSSISELEIDNSKNLCKSAYIMFKIINIRKLLKKINFNDNIKSYFVSWTTTLWTLLDIQALSVNKNLYYNVILFNKKIYISSNELINIIKNKLYNFNYKILGKLKGSELIHLKCEHPLNFKNILNLVLNDSITYNIGTSIVNISPGHNIIDYDLGIKNNLEIINNIDEEGFYYNKFFFDKKYFVFDLISKIKKRLIINNKLFFYEEFYNKYPYCNRHKFPIIFRSIYQWFIKLNHNNLINRSIEYSKKVNWIPKWGKERIKEMLKTRSDWCISRQRKWGVPITFFIKKKDNTIHYNSENFLKKISKHVKKNGIEYWWKLNKKSFLKKNEYKEYFKSNDILDVWFDSGISLLFIIDNNKKFKNKIADLYLEGSDQYRGWFVSSLLIFVAINDKSPYKNVITHGFVLDNLNYEKMSKSKGNVINIDELLKNYGSDIIRLWISCSNYTKDIKISNETLERISDIYKKIRNTIKFLISNLYDFNPNNDLLKFNKMVKIDQWIIDKLYNIQNIIKLSYNNFNFNNVINNIINFCTIDLGSIYFEIIKDRQYLLNKNSIYRKSSQSAMFHIIETITRIISPILSFTSEEIWSYIPGKRSISIFTEIFYKNLKKFNKTEYFNGEYWNFIFNIKKEINIITEKYIKSKIIKNTLEVKIILFVINNKKFFNKLYKIKNELKYIFIVSSTKIINIKKSIKNNNNINNSNINFIKIKLLKLSKSIKCKRCWNYYNKKLFNFKYNICNRCYNNIYRFGEIRKFA